MKVTLKLKTETTKQDFEYFTRRVRFWQRKLGFTWNEVKVIHGDQTKGGDECSAWYESCFGGRLITIGLSTLHSEPVTKKYLDMCAFHEIFESMLSDLRYFAMGYYSRGVVEEATHNVVRALENTVFESLRGKG